MGKHQPAANKKAAKHTPGPWRAEQVGSGGSHDNPTDVYEITNGYTRIAEYVADKDAHLIAAAPELLEALTLALEVVEACDAGVREEGEEEMSLTTICKAALAKAVNSGQSA